MPDDQTKPEQLTMEEREQTARLRRLSRAHLAIYLAVSRRTVERYPIQGPSIEEDGRYVWRRSILDGWIDAHAIDPLRLGRAPGIGPYLRPAEAAEYCGITYDALFSTINQETGPRRYRLSANLVRFRRHDLDRWNGWRVRTGRLPAPPIHAPNSKLEVS